LKLIYKISVLLTLLITSFATFTSSHAEELPNVISLFGDSISVGFSRTNFNVVDGGARANFGAPSIELSTILNSSMRGSTVVNTGFGGTPSGPSSNPNQQDASISGVGRVDNTLATVRGLFQGQVYYALILYGTNDFAFGVSPSDTHWNIRLIVQSARRQGFIPVVGSITVNTVFDVTSYNQQIFNAAIAEGAAFVNINGAITVNQLADQLHPSPQGYQLIAQKWFDDFLEKNIAKDTNPSIAPIYKLLLD